jgi:undecaprenyl diphosphate synthase
VAGAENLNTVIDYLNERQIKYVTVYTFSTENWNRPEDEVKGLFRLSEERIKNDLPKLHKKGIRFCHLGRLQELPQSLQEAINKALELTKNNTGMTLSLAFNYGGRTEILDAIRRLIADGIAPEKVDEKLFTSYLYTTDLPDVDLLIRTANELRLSNFLLWQTAYSEYYFTKVLWPDFNEKEVDKALLAYSQRQRRFGGL